MLTTRRSALKTAAAAGATAAFAPLFSFGRSDANGADDQFHDLRFGVCSYSLRAFPADEMLSDAHRLGVRYLSLKDVHLPLTSRVEQRHELRKKANDLGLTITSCGLIYLTDDADAMRKAKVSSRCRWLKV